MVYFKGFGNPNKWQIKKCIDKHKDKMPGIAFGGSFKTECDECTSKLDCKKMRRKIK